MAALHLGDLSKSRALISIINPPQCLLFSKSNIVFYTHSFPFQYFWVKLYRKFKWKILKNCMIVSLVPSHHRICSNFEFPNHSQSTIQSPTEPHSICQISSNTSKTHGSELNVLREDLQLQEERTTSGTAFFSLCSFIRVFLWPQ